MGTIEIVSPCGVTYFWETKHGLRGWYTAEELAGKVSLPAESVLINREINLEPEDES